MGVMRRGVEARVSCHPGRPVCDPSAQAPRDGGRDAPGGCEELGIRGTPCFGGSGCRRKGAAASRPGWFPMTPGLLLSLLVSQTPVSDIHYTAESVEEGVQRTLESYSFTEWEPSGKTEALYVGVDEANLRQTASAEGAVVATLPLGAAVRVLEKGKERLKVGEYVNHWYSVEYVDAKGTADAADDAVHKGWLFGNTLTPFRFEEDFDGDGEKEVATVVMSGDFKIRVRVLEPNVKPPRRVSSVDVSPSGEGYLSVS